MLKLFCNDKEVQVKQWKFPAGEIGIKIEQVLTAFHPVFIELKYENSDDIISLLLLVDALRNINKHIVSNLNIPYFPYARQDRVCAVGESFSLKVVANLIANCKFNSVEVKDTHSTVLEAFFDAGVLRNKPQFLIASQYLTEKQDYALISPDAGALKKIYDLAKLCKAPVIEARKIRSVEDGSIVATSIDNNDFFKYTELVVVDDICDGGRTFVELGKVIRQDFKGKLTLIVTHGIFSQGFTELNKYFDEIKFNNDLRKVK